MYIINLFY
ncbi:hypothetical protein LINPERPRIM_LOCUS20063 [Linum perenne]